jgi:ketosteroid isomerase-like protein
MKKIISTGCQVMAFIIVYTKTKNMKLTNLFHPRCLFAITLLLLAIHGTAQSSGQSNEKIVRTVYAAYEKKDWNMLKSVLAEGFTFSSPVNVPPIGIKEYKEQCWPNSANLKKFELDKLVVDGDNVFVSYHSWTLNGKVLWNTECFTLKDGKIKKFVCFFGPGIGYPNNTGK